MALMAACSSPAGPSDAPAENADSGAISAPAVEPRPIAFSIHLSAPDVPPGGEGLHCIDVPGPAVDTYVSGWSVKRFGVHHVNAHIRTKGTPLATWGACVDVFGSSDLIFVAVNDVTETIPDGAAFLIPGGSSLVFDEHYVNTSSEPAPERATIDFYAAPSHDTRVYAMNLAQSGTLALAPHSTKAVSFTAAPQVPIKIVSMLGHMHAHGVSETIAVGGAEVYRTDSWSDPSIEHPTDLIVSPSAPLSWSCDYRNDGETTVQWGTLIATTEMCQVLGLVTTNHWRATGMVAQ
jgi:hypothetical protein